MKENLYKNDDYQLHDVCLISDQYIVIKGLTYLKYFTCYLMLKKTKLLKNRNPLKMMVLFLVFLKNKFFNGHLNIGVLTIKHNFFFKKNK